MIRRHGARPRPGLRHAMRPGAYAILIRDGRILLTGQDTASGLDVQLPGGGIDPGESPRPALLREVMEETGHGAAPIRHLATYRRFVWMPDYAIHAEKVCHVFLGRPGPRRGPPTEPGHRAIWADPGDAVGLLWSDGDAAVLRSYLSGRLPSGRKVK
ncbi:NUDIX domain-containing protein [Jannaschia sp. LMIT008]|uniref:NUDIX domain-containing protein n=1 Tax=Jannaschia maritima TaxID=3032585 RepID=UPI0028119CFD|nr:NUDIX domain-containing protein [Jannaschia sp. LMIT008]